ncbi:hypothetical protein TWF694_007517 [Orbilia ellipsospora]|uniref:Wings apart-like protein C-terminal domain-containing protein n=1 Tax=Orbilia ellipsospora TaxID=2528407 RepID=A0AAV9XKJ6_9PEZI
MMRERKTYRGARLSTGLKDEFNDIFKARAMEKKGVQSSTKPDSENTQAQPAQQKKTTSILPVTTVIKNAASTKIAKKRTRDEFDMDSSDDEDIRSKPKEVRPPITKKITGDGQNGTKPRSSVKPVNVTKPAPVVKITKKAERDIFGVDLSEDEGIGHSSKETLQPKIKKPTAETRNGANGKKLTTRTVVSSASNSDGEQNKLKPQTKILAKQAPNGIKKPDLKVTKRKVRASSDSESDVQAKSRKTKPSKDTGFKRKLGREADVDGVQKPPTKRQDRTAKTHHLPYPISKTENSKKQSNGIVRETTSSKFLGKKPASQETEAMDLEPVDIEIPIYDHAVDLSYASLSSPAKKVPTLAKEPSAVEMPALLTELIESAVADIEEHQPMRKIKRPVKKPKPVEEPVIKKLELISQESSLTNVDTETDSQSQSQLATFAADSGVKTTRSKFRNEGAAKKSYGVAQRTMRQPVTEEEQMEDQKLELDRTREEAANKARREEEKQKKEAEVEKAPVSKKTGKGKANEKETAGKGKGKMDEYDMDDDGPKVMSRHALLQKGRHQRVLNEIDGLIEDSRKENPTRRSSILDFAFKMSSNTDIGKEFVQKFRLNSYDSKLLRDLDKEQDELTRIGYGWIIFILLNEELHSGRAIDLMLENGGFEMLNAMLSSDEDLDELAKSSVLKLQIQINMLTGKLRSRLLECRFIRDNKPGNFSQRYIALMILNTMFKSVSKDEGRKAILEKFDPRQFVEILSPLTRFVDPPTGPAITNFSLSTSILSHYSQGARIYSPLNELLESDHIEILSNVLPTVLDWQILYSTEDVDHIKDFQAAVLKLCIDRTNDDPETSTMIADHRNGLAMIAETCTKQFHNLNNIGAQENDVSKDIDILVLTSILLSNLLEFSETARIFLRSQKLGKNALIKSLMDTFVARHDRLELAESVEETHLNVAFGYLTVALAYACRDHEIRTQVRTQLRGTLEPLILAVTAFKVQNQTLEEVENAISSQDDLLLDLGEDAPTKLSYTSRLEDILDELRNYRAR